MSEPHQPAVGSREESVRPDTSTYPAGPAVAPIEQVAAERATARLCPEIDLDLRPGGRVYSFRWEEPDPDDRTTTVTLSLRDLGEATEVSLTQGEFATDARLELHRDGWTDSFAKLGQFVQSSS